MVGERIFSLFSQIDLLVLAERDAISLGRRAVGVVAAKVEEAHLVVRKMDDDFLASGQGPGDLLDSRASLTAKRPARLDRRRDCW